MLDLSLEQFGVLLAMCLLVLGVLTFGVGVFLLLFKGAGGNLHTIAAQTTRLAQKGLADDISGLVGNISALVDALNQMSKTATGVGVFLVLIGLLLLTGAYWVMRGLGR